MPQAAPKPPTQTPLVRGHMTLDPGGIEVFAALMHVVHAHIANPSAIGDAAHHKQAIDYIRHFQRTASVERIAADAASATYAIGYPGRAPLQFRVVIGKPLDQAFSVMLANGAYVPVDLTMFAVRRPG